VVKDEENGDDRFQITPKELLYTVKPAKFKDPSQNITWVTPEGAGGPNYPNM